MSFTANTLYIFHRNATAAMLPVKNCIEEAQEESQNTDYQ